MPILRTEQALADGITERPCAYVGSAGRRKGKTAFAANQRDEVMYLHDAAGHCVPSRE